jgi:hypothetical protein
MSTLNVPTTNNEAEDARDALLWHTIKEKATSALQHVRPKVLSKRYIRREEITNLGITCGELDYKKGTSALGQSFLELMSDEDFEKIAKQCGFDGMKATQTRTTSL